MIATYNLSKRDQHEEAVALVDPLCLRGDSMNIYAGHDEAGSPRILVQSERSSVLLHVGALDLRHPPRRAPVSPWLFEIESVKPLLVGANFYYVSTTRFQVWIGDDKERNEFIVTRQMPEGPLFLFRAPVHDRSHCYVQAWPLWAARPIHDFRKTASGDAAGAAIAAAQTTAGIRPGTGDPEMDQLLRGLGDR